MIAPMPTEINCTTCVQIGNTPCRLLVSNLAPDRGSESALGLSRASWRRRLELVHVLSRGEFDELAGSRAGLSSPAPLKQATTLAKRRPRDGTTHDDKLQRRGVLRALAPAPRPRLATCARLSPQNRLGKGLSSGSFASRGRFWRRPISLAERGQIGRHPFLAPRGQVYQM